MSKNPTIGMFVGDEEIERRKRDRTTPPPDTQVAETLDIKRYVHFDSMTWPTADSDLEWRLRYSQDSITAKDKFYLASVMDAYSELIRCNREKRESVCRTIREGR